MATGIDAQRNALRALETDIVTTYPPIVEALQHRLEAAFTAADHELAALEAATTKITDEYIAELTALKAAVLDAHKEIDTLDTQNEFSINEATGDVGELSTLHDHDSQAIATEFDHLEAAYAAVQDSLQTEVTVLVQKTGQYLGFLKTGHAALAEHGQKYTAGIDSAKNAALADVKTMEGTLGTLVSALESEHAAHDTDHAHQTDATHQTTTAQLAHNLELMSQGVTGAFSAMSVLDQFGHAFPGVLDEGAKGVTEILTEIGHIVDSIKPVLEAVKAIA